MDLKKESRFVSLEYKLKYLEVIWQIYLPLCISCLVSLERSKQQQPVEESLKPHPPEEKTVATVRLVCVSAHVEQSTEDENQKSIRQSLCRSGLECTSAAALESL